MSNNLRAWSVLALGATVMGACSLAPSTETTNVSRADLVGNASYNSCSRGEAVSLDRALFYGRSAIASQPFKQCVQRAMVSNVVVHGRSIGPYVSCKGDPDAGQSIDQQTSDLLAAAAASNDIHFNCVDSRPGPPVADLLPAGTLSGTEVVSFGQSLYTDYNTPVPEAVGGPTFGALAGIIWQNALRQHGYNDGAGSSASSDVVCGYPSGTTTIVNSANYIVRSCIDSVIQDSAAVCNLHQPSCPNGLMLESSLDASTCACAATTLPALEPRPGQSLNMGVTSTGVNVIALVGPDGFPTSVSSQLDASNVPRPWNVFSFIEQNKMPVERVALDFDGANGTAFFSDPNGFIWTDRYDGQPGEILNGLQPHRAVPGGYMTAIRSYGDLDLIYVDNLGQLHILNGTTGRIDLLSGSIAPPGAVVATGKQGPYDQTDVFFVDNSGHVNVAWSTGQGRWAGPVVMSNLKNFLMPPGAPVATAQQGLNQVTTNQIDLFFVDRFGTLNVTWARGDTGWFGPAAISDAFAAPVGANIATAVHGANETDVFFVDANGALDVLSVVGFQAWSKPVALTPSSFAPAGGAVAAASWRGDINAALVGYNGLYVLNGPYQKPWGPPVLVY